mgnify:CR=1 FL=1
MIYSKGFGARSLQLALLFSQVISSGLIGQKDTNNLGTDFASAEVSIYYPRHQFKIQAELGAASQQLSTQDLFTIGTQKFLNDQDKTGLLSQVKNQLVLGYRQSLEIGYYERFQRPQEFYTPDYRQGLSFFNRVYTALNFNKNALALALNGNSPYAGQSLDLSGSTFEDWYYSGFKYSFSFPFLKSRAYMAASFLAAHSHARYEFDNTQLFTASDGSYVQTDGGYKLQQASGNGNLAIAGIGLALDFHQNFLFEKSKITFNLQDFGAFAFTQGEQVSRSTPYRFDGVVLNDVFTLSDSLFSAEADRITGELYNPDQDNYWRLAPFRASFGYTYTFNHSNWLSSAFAKIDYHNLPGYFPRTQLGTTVYENTNNQFRAAMAYGGFNELALDAQYALRVGYFEMYMGLSNVFGAALPGLSGGTFINFGLNYNR